MVHIATIFLLLILTAAVSVSAEAGWWRDDFHTKALENWWIEPENFVQESVWRVQDGFLTATIQTEWAVKYELFGFRALPRPYHQFIVQAENLGGEGANIGLGLAKIFPDAPGAKWFFYLFFPHQIAATRFNGENGNAPFLVRVPQHPDTFWDTWELEELEVRFTPGHFQLFADGTQRAAFQDVDFSFIDIIGFVIEGNNHRKGRVWADAFTISGPALEVSPTAKMTTTWGYLKNQP